jgi:hypothetical protein
MLQCTTPEPGRARRLRMHCPGHRLAPKLPFWGRELGVAGPDAEVLAVLESVGLAVLAARFAAEDIDGRTLWSLQEDDLAELGLDAGQRAVLLERLKSGGAARLGDNVPAPLAVAAAEAALQRSAIAEAAGFLRQAKTALGRMGDTEQADALRLRALIARSSIARVQQGIASDEAGRLGREVLALAQKLRESRAELMALTGLYTHALVRAEYFVAGKWAELLCERAEQARDPTFRMIGRRGMGVVALHTGALTQAVMALEEALESYDEAQHLPLAYAHGYDHAEICAAFLSIALWITGDPAEARKVSAFSVSHARRIGHMHSLAQALVFRAMLMALAEDWEDCRAAARDGEELGRQHGLEVMGTACSFFGTVAEACLAPPAPGAAELKALRRSHEAFRRVNPYNYQQVCGLLLARLHLRSGGWNDAADALDQAEAVQARTRESFLVPELMRMRAQLLAATGEERRAQDQRMAALQAAGRMGAPMFTLRIACDMAEHAPSAETRAQLAAARARLASDDGGADLIRCARLLGEA